MKKTIHVILTIFSSLKGDRMKSIPLLFVVLLVALPLRGKGKYNNYLYVCIYFFVSGTPRVFTNRSLILTLRGNFESINSHQWISALKPYFMMYLVYIWSDLKSFWSKQTADFTTKFPQERHFGNSLKVSGFKTEISIRNIFSDSLIIITASKRKEILAVAQCNVSECVLLD